MKTKIDLSTEKMNADIQTLDAVYSSMQIGSSKILVTICKFADQYGIDELPQKIQDQTKITDAFISSFSHRLVIELEV